MRRCARLGENADGAAHVLREASAALPGQRGASGGGDAALRDAGEALGRGGGGNMGSEKRRVGRKA